MSGKTPYQVLGVDENADMEAIKRAYHQQALRCHPDKPTGSHMMMLELQEAYGAILSKKKEKKTPLEKKDAEKSTNDQHRQDVETPEGERGDIDEEDSEWEDCEWEDSEWEINPPGTQQQPANQESEYKKDSSHYGNDLKEGVKEAGRNLQSAASALHGYIFRGSYYG